ncbi:MAG: PSD1 domain-containing protein [Acidobacteriia bacterium]|nr:PSD1 domain-containing protein [Terriglobia bacterium]
MRLLLLLALPLAAQDDGVFFESKIRPLLATNCFACHTGSALGDLRLDSRAGILKGGKTGVVVVAGKPEESLLIQAVRRTHVRLKMPPVGALTQQEIALLEEWVRRGVPWPEAALPTIAATTTKISAEQRSFWSFQPVTNPTPPKVKNEAWIRTPVDRFVLARLEAKGLKPVPVASKRTWLRRVTLDLLGLPPTPEEMDAFLADATPKAQTKVVDRLLASPHYGERWARHWLDLARYSDGELAAGVDTPLANAWRYRDWVVDAFNNDLPYNQFVRAQIAADFLPSAGRESLMPGLGFQALGRTADDQVDVSTKVFLGLTVGCAQCHDHKYDPIPTKDYYSLLGVFRGSKDFEFPLVSESEVKAYREKKKKLDAINEMLNDFLAEQSKQVVDHLSRDTAQYLMAVWKNASAQEGLDTETIGKWKTYLNVRDKDHPYLKSWYDLMAGNPTEEQVRAEAARYQQFVLELLEEAKEVEDKNYVAFGGKKGIKDEKTRQYTNIVALPVLKFYQWRELANGPYNIDGFRAPAGVYYYGPKELDRYLGGVAKQYVDRLRAEANAIEKDLPPMYPFLHTVSDTPKPADIHVALRGDNKSPGEIAPRRFLSVLCEGEATPFQKGSGRGELAEAIASQANPLTARVMVNRIWQHHFGQGIVRSPSNFGQMGERPTHPELLDYLASRFVESGWSVKAIHREILLSSAYALSSQSNEANLEADPDNKLLWRHNMQYRLDMEALRDSVLAVSGQLDRKFGGPASAMTEANARRSLYLTVSRTRLDATMALFDFPDANASAEERPVTAGPLQGLYWLNSKFVAAQAKALEQRLAREAGTDTEKRIQRAYQLMYGRPPDAEELKLGVEYVAAGGNVWQQYLQALFGSGEFTSVN